VHTPGTAAASLSGSDSESEEVVAPPPLKELLPGCVLCCVCVLLCVCSVCVLWCVFCCVCVVRVLCCVCACVMVCV